jgi:hypothetical protein
MMWDRTIYHRQLLARFGRITELRSDTLKGHRVPSSTGARTETFDADTRESIAPGAGKRPADRDSGATQARGGIIIGFTST